MPELAQISETSQTAPVPRLLVELPSWPRVFLGNLRDLVFPERLPALELRSAPAPFWHDVFVKRGFPWFSFLESGVFHAIVFALLISLSKLLAIPPQPELRPAFDPHAQVIYYNPSDYLPPLDTRSQPAAPAKADPEYARQPIISVPPEADNRSQTIVTPRDIKLKHDIRLPNIVAWSDKMQRPQLAIPPPPLTQAAELTRLAPRMENSVVAPPPDASHLTHRAVQPNLQTAVVAPPPELLKPRDGTAIAAPEPAVVAPPPVIDNAPTRQLGELTIGRSAVIAPAPQMPVGEQRAVVSGRSRTGIAPQVVSPPPSISGLGSTADGGAPGRVIALNLHPAVDEPPVAPSGNRRGAFAATPEGHAGASGSPGGSSVSTAGRGSGTGNGPESSRKGSSDLPAGLYVGSPAPAVKTSPIAGDLSNGKASVSGDPGPGTPHASTPHGSGIPAHAVAPEGAAKLSEPERAVFGIRRFYDLTVNMPNLNSAGGSWVIRFAELNAAESNHDPAAPAASITQPVATRKVDPGYPTQLIRENVTGTVIVYAVIHADGSVSNVKVLRGVDDRLDRYACDAVAQWKFQPATKNGVPVDVEATFQIPFRPPKLASAF
jgi:TonB family protein